MDVKVQRDTKVIVSLSEAEAGKLMYTLIRKVDFDKEPWARELFESLDANNVRELSVASLSENLL